MQFIINVSEEQSDHPVQRPQNRDYTTIDCVLVTADGVYRKHKDVRNMAYDEVKKLMDECMDEMETKFPWVEGNEPAPHCQQEHCRMGRRCPWNRSDRLYG